ncbi:hypothetical protein [Siphonobacter sp. SORGH_AS_0500]|uniref:hypothetical protein n=1 Tax=Siphonobacter sp. SORGH_AS_0500 TaxID=1864824 RepID=UPI00285CCFA1|nr:hypothetical protein [Siphonobacter sp. SORGH_AS_0500]MDR6195668.1 hypothetical protein [Siphonobacter sp. SORGH_AS_0500]
MINISNLGFGEVELPSQVAIKEQVTEFFKKESKAKKKTKKVLVNRYRSLSKSELTVAVELTFLSTCVLNRIDELKHTSLYSKEVKAATNLLETELEQYTDANMWSEIEGKSAHNAMEQLDMGSQFVDRFLRLSTQALDFEQEKYEAYVNAIETVNQQFGLTLLWKPNDPKA